MRARTLLLADNGPHGPGWSNARIAEALGVTSRTVENTKKRLVEHDIAAAIERKKRDVPPIEPKFDAKKEAHGVLSHLFYNTGQIKSRKTITDFVGLHVVKHSQLGQSEH
ncbi:MAG: helix-turn-helix domain-containing protein [Desulfohalobiaceae bacterium]